MIMMHEVGIVATTKLLILFQYPFNLEIICSTAVDLYIIGRLIKSQHIYLQDKVLLLAVVPELKLPALRVKRSVQR